VLLHIVQDAFVAKVIKVEMELAERRLSYILAMVSAGVVALERSMIILFVGDIRLISKARMFSIAWSVFVAMHNAVASHQASHQHSMVP